MPARLIERLLAGAREVPAGDPVMVLGAALDAVFRFSPLLDGPWPRPVMLLGPPGAGKTVTTAKLAARAMLAQRPVGVITTDTARAGGVDQLASFTKLLKVNTLTAEGPEALARSVADSAHLGLVLIDTAGANAYDPDDMAALAALVDAARAEAILVLAAGGDPREAADLAESFAAAGATRLVVTRIDAARRFGSILAAADAGGLRFCEISQTRHVGNGLQPVNPVSLARLFMRGGQSHPTKPSRSEALT